jgi:alpha-L-fucosidase
MPGEDYQVFERDVPGENSAGLSGQAVSKMPLETCQTINGSWGYNITDNRYKSTTELVHLLVRTAGTGANLLLNVGPAPDGTIDPTSTQRLKEMGEWLTKYGHTIYQTTAGPLKPQPWGAITRRDNKLYIHILNVPAEGALALSIPGLTGARWLNLDQPLNYSTDRKTGFTTFLTTNTTPDPTDSIIEVTVR